MPNLPIRQMPKSSYGPPLKQRMRLCLSWLSTSSCRANGGMPHAPPCFRSSHVVRSAAFSRAGRSFHAHGPEGQALGRTESMLDSLTGGEAAGTPTQVSASPELASVSTLAQEPSKGMGPEGSWRSLAGGGTTEGELTDVRRANRRCRKRREGEGEEQRGKRTR